MSDDFRVYYHTFRSTGKAIEQIHAMLANFLGSSKDKIIIEVIETPKIKELEDKLTKKQNYIDKLLKQAGGYE